MNDVDDILRGMGIETSSPPPTNTIETPASEAAPSAFSDEDVDDILQENGFSAPEEEDDTDSLERESEEVAGSESSPTTMEDFQEAIDEHLGENPAPIENPIEENLPSAEEQEEESTSLPLNSPTLLIDNSTSRFSGAEWFNEIQKARIIVGGCGGIGSNLAFQLARMIPANITVYDDDVVEMANLAGQLYAKHDVGKYKVDAIAQMVSAYTNMSCFNAIRAKFTETTEAGDIMLCGFDNMRARKTFFESWRNHVEGKTDEERAKCLYLDGRLSMDTLQILCIKGDDSYSIQRYSKEFLFSDYEADATVCSMKQTTYLACMIGSLMVNLFTNFIAGTLNPVIPYDLPFFTEYDAQNMIFKTES